MVAILGHLVLDPGIIFQESWEKVYSVDDSTKNRWFLSLAMARWDCPEQSSDTGGQSVGIDDHLWLLKEMVHRLE